MTAQPCFALTGPSGSLVVDDAGERFSTITAADAALRSGHVPLVLGALPFNLDHPAALMAPEVVRRGDGLPDWPTDPLPTVRIAAALPPPTDYRARIARARDRLAATDNPLSKVVLARSLQLTAESSLDARMILCRLVSADPDSYGYLVDLSAAGAPYTGTVLVGASPELLVARVGDRVTCQPFAGSAPRAADPAVDAANGAALVRSAKNRREHQLVIDTMRAALAPLCADLTISADPQLTCTSAVWHLRTLISGRLRDPSTSALDLALALHPTPAVGGVPTADATALIGELEGDRGFYAGAVGWCDSAGDGYWVVSIRCAQLSRDRLSLIAQAGGGIVAESDPTAELDETTTKFGTILSALGAVPQPACRPQSTAAQPG